MASKKQRLNINEVAAKMFISSPEENEQEVQEVHETQEVQEESAQQVHDVQEEKTRQVQEAQEVQEVSAQQVQEDYSPIIKFGATQGKKGHRAPRINMAFSPENHAWIKTKSRQMGITATDLVNNIIERERKNQ